MIFVLLPAYNEELSLPKLLPKINSVLKEIGEKFLVIVCNDGSNDRTSELLEKYRAEIPIYIINHKINRGLGETVRDLFEYAADLSSDDDVMIRMDCDDTHEPEFIPNLIAALDNHVDVVTASRFAHGGGQQGVSTYRAFVSRAANVFMRLFFPVAGLKEYSCGFRAYKAKIIKKAIKIYGNDFIQLKGLGFTCTLEKLVKLKILDAAFTEIPFVLRYDQKLSNSKMVSSITAYGYLTMTLLYYWPWGGWKRSYKKKLTEITKKDIK